MKPRPPHRVVLQPEQVHGDLTGITLGRGRADHHIRPVVTRGFGDHHPQLDHVGGGQPVDEFGRHVGGLPQVPGVAEVDPTLGALVVDRDPEGAGQLAGLTKAVRSSKRGGILSRISWSAPGAALRLSTSSWATPTTSSVSPALGPNSTGTPGKPLDPPVVLVVDDWVTVVAGSGSCRRSRGCRSSDGFDGRRRGGGRGRGR